MDSSARDYDNEVVADSEGEDNDILEHSAFRQDLGDRVSHLTCQPTSNHVAHETMLSPTKAAASITNMDIDCISSNIADRAKLRSRTTKPLGSSSHIIELSSDDDDLNLLPQSKTREHRNTALKPKESRQTRSHSQEPSAPNSKPRPRPRPILKSIKSRKTTHPTSPVAASTSQVTTPLPSSSLPDDELPIPFRLLPSQLPPSDPPSSTINPYDHPPIETLPNINTELDLPSSSPSSLFSVCSPRKKKRMRQTSPIDELDLDDNAVADTGRMPPPDLPQTFFAGSSLPTDLTNAGKKGSDKEAHRKQHAKNRKPRKNVGAEPGVGEYAIPALTMSKTKSKSKKVAKDKVEVVIDRTSKARDKGKGKEVFKSREFIEEDDDGVIETRLNTMTARERAGSMTSLSSVPDSDSQDNIPQAGPGKKRKSIDEHDPPTKTGALGVPQPKKRAKTNGKLRQIIFSDGEDSGNVGLRKQPAIESTAKGKRKQGKVAQEKEDPEVTHQSTQDQAVEHPISKENIQPIDLGTPVPPKPSIKPAESPFPSLASRYTITPKTKATPMSDLIRRVNSIPGSPFHSPAPRSSTSSVGRLQAGGTAYSPYLKSSRSALSRIAPLHPNRRTPPPPLPPPPPRKKTKKEIEREEKWEEELVESVGGITEWACMTDVERAELRRAKREKEMVGWDD